MPQLSVFSSNAVRTLPLARLLRRAEEGRRSVKSSDPRTSVRRQVEAIIAEQKELPDLSQLRAAGDNAGNNAGGARGNANANNANDNDGDDQDDAAAARRRRWPRPAGAGRWRPVDAVDLCRPCKQSRNRPACCSMPEPISIR